MLCTVLLSARTQLNVIINIRYHENYMNKNEISDLLLTNIRGFVMIYKLNFNLSPKNEL
jgi:hypothetical protein